MTNRTWLDGETIIDYDTILLHETDSKDKDIADQLVSF